MTFYETLRAAIRDFSEHGYDSEERLTYWSEKIKQAAIDSLVPQHVMEQSLRSSLGLVYRRLVDKEGLLKSHLGISRYTIEKVKPQLRAELDRRVLASANLIKLNRSQMVDLTLRRFQGWATSVPLGGSEAIDMADEVQRIKKTLASQTFEQRRVAIDQGHKLAAAINDIVAKDGGALAAVWHSRWRAPGYNYREDHKDRDEKAYAIRDSWAFKQGLVKAGEAGYTDEITRPAEEVYCFPGDSKIPFADGVRKAFRRWYSGELSEIVTASGKTLRGTPNHPVLTLDGWLPIGSLKEGDYVAEIPNELAFCFGGNNDDGIPTLDQIFATLQKDSITEPCRGSNADFHGDGRIGQVDIVFSTRGLNVSKDAQFAQRINQLPFTEANLLAAALCSFDERSRIIQRAPQSIMSIGGQCASLLSSEFAHSQKTGLNKISADDASISQSAGDGVATDFRSAMDCKDTFAGLVSFTKLCSARRVDFEGHVYNLETSNGWYVAGAIIAHNCSCKYQYLYNLRDLAKHDMLTDKGEQALAQAKLKIGLS